MGKEGKREQEREEKKIRQGDYRVIHRDGKEREEREKRRKERRGKEGKRRREEKRGVRGKRGREERERGKRDYDLAASAMLIYSF